MTETEFREAMRTLLNSQIEGLSRGRIIAISDQCIVETLQAGTSGTPLTYSELLCHFRTIPARFAGKRGIMDLVRGSDFCRVDDAECEAFGLPIGDTIKCACRISPMGDANKGAEDMPDIDDLSIGPLDYHSFHCDGEPYWTVYAVGNLAVQLLDIPVGSKFKVLASTVFGIHEERDELDNYRKVGLSGLRVLRLHPGEPIVVDVTA